MSEPARNAAMPGEDDATMRSGGVEGDILAMVKRLSSRPIDPAPAQELMADLGFDSLQVLELVGEIEDHFRIAVPLNALTHIRTVHQIAEEVERIIAEGQRGRE